MDLDQLRPIKFRNITRRHSAKINTVKPMHGPHLHYHGVCTESMQYSKVPRKRLLWSKCPVPTVGPKSCVGSSSQGVFYFLSTKVACPKQTPHPTPLPFLFQIPTNTPGHLLGTLWYVQINWSCNDCAVLRLFSSKSHWLQLHMYIQGGG